jgi:hypothetical protein
MLDSDYDIDGWHNLNSNRGGDTFRFATTDADASDAFASNQSPIVVSPAKAWVQWKRGALQALGPRFRGEDKVRGLRGRGVLAVGKR